MDVEIHVFLTTALVTREWSVSRPLDRRLGGPEGLDDKEKRQLLNLPRLKYDPLVGQPVISRYVDWTAAEMLRGYIFWDNAM
jgi:hypothetical protein